MDWDVGTIYDEQEFTLKMDFDKYFDSFEGLEKIKMKILGKTYLVTRKQLVRMMEALESI